MLHLSIHETRVDGKCILADQGRLLVSVTGFHHCDTKGLLIMCMAHMFYMCFETAYYMLYASAAG